MRPLTTGNLLAILKSFELNAEEEPTTGQVYAPITTQHGEVPLFCLVLDSQLLLQFCAVFPSEVTEKTAPDTARLLHVLNKDIDMPGFGMDEEKGTIFYRIMVPCLNKEIDKELVKITIDAVTNVCDHFMPAVHLVANGDYTLERLIEESKAMEAKNSGQQS